MMTRGWIVWVLAGLAFAQDGVQKKDASVKDASAKDAQAKKDQPAPAKPAPLFGGKLGIRSSDKTKESATMGFNGIDPSGKVDQKMLGTTATAADQAKAKELTSRRPTAAELTAFLQEGGLKQK